MRDTRGRSDEATQSGVPPRFDGKRVDCGVIVGGEHHVRAEIHDSGDRSIVIAPHEEILRATRRLDHGLQKDVLVRSPFEIVDRFTTRRASERLERRLS